MWHEIKNKDDIESFMDMVYCFHDSCIKEIKYLSGAYVEKDLAMYPVNDRRVLKVVIQRQFEDNSMIEMELEGLKRFQLMPCDDEYTCEILDSTMAFKDGCIYWCDCGGISEKDLDEYDGTIICASKLRWRSVDDCMGKREFYTSVK